MSYILDALQRADAERERGHVPGLNSQIVSTPSRKARPVRHRSPARLAVAVAVVIALLVAAGLWWWLGQAEEAPVAAPAPAVAPPAMPPAAAVTQAPAAPSPAASPAPASETVQPILAPPRVDPPPKRPQASSPPTPAPTAAPAAPPANAPAAAAAPVSPAKAPAAAPPAAAPPEANATPVRSFAELSPEARAQLPAVNVSGSTYSKNPALRMLIVNGKVLQEGQEIAPGFKLETIGQRSAVLNHNGLRYSIGY